MGLNNNPLGYSVFTEKPWIKICQPVVRTIRISCDEIWSVMKTVDWPDKAAAYFRSRIIVESDGPILVFRTSRNPVYSENPA
jgi:hypothetical protein